MTTKQRRAAKLDVIEQGHVIPSTIEKVPLGQMTISARAQRDLRPARVAKLVAEMDLDQIGLPVVNERDGQFYIIDGQHRVEALKEWLGSGWEKQRIECRVYKNLTEQQEANIFDRVNDTLPVSAIERFKVRVTAERADEVIVNKILESVGLHVTRHKKRPGSIHCVSTVLGIYRRSGSANLQRTLGIVLSSYGDSGLDAFIISGVSLVLDRYGEAINTDHLVESLQNMRGGVTGLQGRAATIKKQTNAGLAVSTAAAIVDVYNQSRTGRSKKLPIWWKVAGKDSREEVDGSDLKKETKAT